MVDYIEVDMKEFIAGCAKRFCPTCGQEIEIDKSGHTLGRPRKFCSDACRQKFWKAHQGCVRFYLSGSPARRSDRIVSRIRR